MPTRFLLVRHATCARIDEVLFGRALDVPLDAGGRRQAQAVAGRLRDEAPLRVESSPRRRATETAWAVATAAGCGVRITAALDELDFGTWAGKTFAELERDRAWRRWNRDRDHACTPSGTHIRDLQEDLGRYFASLAEGCPGATLVLVTHAEIIRSIVLQCSGAPASGYRDVPVDPASVTRISLDERGMHLHALNELPPFRSAESEVATTESVP